MFTSGFSQAPASEVVGEIRTRGYYMCPQAITDEFLNRIDAEIGPLDLSVNRNDVAPVVFKNQRYFTHCLTRSRSIYELMTSSRLRAIMREYMGGKCRLTDQRVYITERGEKMQWHVDNKLDSGVQTEYPGLIFIVYLCDVIEGQFQIVEGSQAWSADHSGVDFLDSTIETEHSDEIVDLKAPRGSIVIYTSRAVHRAAPITTPGWERKSLYFQVERKDDGGEPILVNTSFLADVDEETAYFLGFGAKPEYKTFPETGIDTLTPAHLVRLAARCMSRAGPAAVMDQLWRLGPDARARLKRLVGRR